MAAGRLLGSDDLAVAAAVDSVVLVLELVVAGDD